MSDRHSRLHHTSWLLLAAAVVACASGGASRSSSTSSTPPAAAPAGRVAGHLVIVGGGPHDSLVMRRFIELAGGKGHARIVVFGMASSDSTTGPEQAQEFREYGVEARSVFLTHAQALADTHPAWLDSASAIWFCGGDQVLLMAALGGTPVEEAMHRRYREGIVIAGTSAGAAVMSQVMLTGEERHPGGARPPADTSQAAFMTIARDDIETVRGFGFVTNAVVDQHFLRRKRHNRLISVVLEHPQLIGVGIDESTAIEVDPDGRWRVLGASAATVYDARQAQVTSGGVLGATGLRLHVLPAGSVYDPSTGQATLGK